jgi:DtxR family Mn-dependent transcriptional regulator
MADAPDMIDPRVEEALEQLYRSAVEGSSASAGGPEDEVLHLAAGLGYLESHAGAWRLTESGRLVAANVVRRHRLAECLLRDVLAVAPDQIDPDACRFEHLLRPGLEEKVCILLGHPSTCPHGQPIPPGTCCQAARAEASMEVTALSLGQVNQEGVVAYLATRDQREIQKLMAMGVLPGVGIRLLQRFPSFVFQVGYSQFTVDQVLADKIHVHWKEPSRAGLPAGRRQRRRRGRNS